METYSIYNNGNNGGFGFSAWHRQNPLKLLNPETTTYSISGLISNGNLTGFLGPQMTVPLILRGECMWSRRQYPSLSVLCKCLRLGRGCSRSQASPARCLHPPRTRNRSDVWSEEHQTAPRSDYQRRLLCLSVGKTQTAALLVKIVDSSSQRLGFSRIT